MEISSDFIKCGIQTAISLKAKPVLFTAENLEGGGNWFCTLKNLASKYRAALLRFYNASGLVFFNI